MRPQKVTVPLILMAVLLAALTAFSAQMCLNDAFSLGADFRILLAASLVGAAASAALLAFKRIWPSLAALALVILAVVWFRTPLLESLGSILYAITEQFARCYAGVSVLGKPGGNPAWVLCLLALPLAWITAWTVCREGSAMAVALSCGPILAVCLVVVDIAPVFWLVLLTGVMLILLLTHSVRVNNSVEGGRLSWWLVLPTVILVGAITILWPPADYVRTDWSDALQTLAEARLSIQRLGTTVLYSGPGWNADLKEVDLASLGPRAETGRQVLTYRASSEVKYLRGVSLGVYQDNTWQAVPQSAFTALTLEVQPQLRQGLARTDGQLLEIRTNAVEPVLYTAYDLDAMPEAGRAVDDAYIQNHQSAQSYQVSYRTGALSGAAVEYTYSDYVQAQYLELPEDLRTQLLELLEANGLTDGASPQAVADWVRGRGTYDMDTPRIPEGEDFALYFLTESHRGYCVHFATATALLLRALDIPARYVTGYAVSGPADTWNAVTEDSAHAWVEYYDPTWGWVPLDPTPAAADTPPAETVEPDVPDEPDEPDEPAETQPEETTPDTPDTPDEPEANNQPETSPDAPETPPAGETGQQPEAPARPLDLRWLWLLTVPGVVGLVHLRRMLVLRGRRERCRRGHPNRRALALWRWIRHLARAEGTVPAEALVCLAEKARFSQHTLTEEELRVLEEARDAAIARLKQRPWRTQLWNRYGLALY